MKFKTSKLFVFLLSFFTVISSFFFIVYASLVFQSLISGISFLDSIFMSPFRFVESTAQSMERISVTFSENIHFKSALYQSEIDKNDLSSIRKENEELRALLNLSSSFSGQKTVNTEVVIRNTVAWLDTLEVNAGKDKGVSEKFLVVANGGLVGLVSDVRQTTSRVSLLTNVKLQENITIKIQTNSGDVYGILSGFDREKSAFIVQQLNDTSAVIEENSRVMTSGLGDYPVENVPIGEVLSSTDAVGGNLDREVLVKPTANFKDISVVMLVGK